MYHHNSMRLFSCQRTVRLFPKRAVQNVLPLFDETRSITEIWWDILVSSIFDETSISHCLLVWLLDISELGHASYRCVCSLAKERPWVCQEVPRGGVATDNLDTCRYEPFAHVIFFLERSITLKWSYMSGLKKAEKFTRNRVSVHADIGVSNCPNDRYFEQTIRNYYCYGASPYVANSKHWIPKPMDHTFEWNADSETYTNELTSRLFQIK